MKAKLLNPLQSLMGRCCEHCIDLLAQNANCSCYGIMKTWFSDLAIMYSLTVASGNNTYIKQMLGSFENHIIPECENKSHCDKISELLGDMVSLLTA